MKLKKIQAGVYEGEINGRWIGFERTDNGWVIYLTKLDIERNAFPPHKPLTWKTLKLAARGVERGFYGPGGLHSK